MEAGYYNHRAYTASGRTPRQFLAIWRRFYDGDRHWVPPYFPALRGALRSAHVARSQPVYLHLEAMPRLDDGPALMPPPGQALLHGGWERPVATVALFNDPRQRATLLGLFRCANDRATLLRLMERSGEEGSQSRLLGPVSLSPYLGAGALASHWNEIPPLHTPYAPPYLAGLMDGEMELARESRLYYLAVGGAGLDDVDGPALLQPLPPEQLAAALSQLFAQVYAGDALFAPPDEEESDFLLAWWGSWLPLSGWLASVDGEPAGFVLLQADGAPWLQRAGGGHRLWRRLWLLAGSKDAERGRLLAGGVLPAWRRQGIGRQLLTAALGSARAAGWHTLIAGPVVEESAAAALFSAAGGEARQRYHLFSWQAQSSGWW
jgi:ribosomal protein S18 acetylase RimI-like enzyme